MAISISSHNYFAGKQTGTLLASETPKNTTRPMVSSATLTTSKPGWTQATFGNCVYLKPSANCAADWKQFAEGIIDSIKLMLKSCDDLNRLAENLPQQTAELNGQGAATAVLKRIKSDQEQLKIAIQDAESLLRHEFSVTGDILVGTPDTGIFLGNFKLSRKMNGNDMTIGYVGSQAMDKNVQDMLFPDEQYSPEKLDPTRSTMPGRMIDLSA